MQAVEEQVERLEELVMKIAYEHLNTEMELQKLTKNVNRFQLEMHEFKGEMKGFKDEMKDFKEEMKDFKDEMKDFKDEMKGFKDEMKGFKDESRAEQKAMNKRWGELANKLGTVVEDIVAPNIRRIAREYFDCPELDFFAVRVDKRKPGDPTAKREFDVVAVGGDLVFLNETKSTVRESYVREFIEFVDNKAFFDYFPEYAGKGLIPLFASLSVPDDKVKILSKAGIYVMTMTDTTMDLVNYGDVAKN